MRPRTYRYFSADFETTVYSGQTRTDVWASASVELYTEDVKIFHTIGEQFEYFVSLNENLIVYYHNLKFDGSFWLNFLLKDMKYEQAYYEYNEGKNGDFVKESKMKNNTVTYSISEMGQWYWIKVKINNKIIEFRDSLKLLPFSVEKIGKSFGTKHKKKSIEYTGFRYPGCEITDKEKEYIANDVLVVKEALELMYNEGHSKLTIGSCCLSEYKRIIGKKEYTNLFPNLYEQEIDFNTFGFNSAGEYIRKSYRGGWCYLVKGAENKIKTDGTTADVNSLYPSMMHSESGNRYPVGTPTFWVGDYIPDKAYSEYKYFFVRIKTSFRIKKGHLPFIQIKNNIIYKSTESLETSEYYDKTDGKYYNYYTDKLGITHDTRVEMTLTQTDFKLILEHYDLIDFEIIDGCYFDTAIGIFDDYINHYRKIKIESQEKEKRNLAKLFLNNLYGKMATSPDSAFKVAYIKEDGSLGYKTLLGEGKKPGYIPVGSAITSYARNFTIRAAQKNYHGPDKRGFIYADTDSIHCDLKPEEIVGIKVHSKDFCCWKLESCWDKAIFVRQKTYIEHITHEDLEPIDKPYYNVKCAGMPEKCKELFLYSIGDEETIKELNKKHTELGTKFTEDEKEFISKKRTISDFKRGLIVPGKLLPKNIPGGVLLCDTSYEMR